MNLWFIASLYSFCPSLMWCCNIAGLNYSVHPSTHEVISKYHSSLQGTRTHFLKKSLIPCWGQKCTSWDREILLFQKAKKLPKGKWGYVKKSRNQLLEASIVHKWEIQAFLSHFLILSFFLHLSARVLQ